VEYIHVLNCQNLIAQPLDPVLIGMLAKSEDDFIVKSYDAKNLDWLPENANFLAMNPQGALEIVFMETIEDYHRTSGQIYTPRYLYMTDFVMRYEFLKDPKMLRSFNFMQR
jgi:hypothetical protein